MGETKRFLGIKAAGRPRGNTDIILAELLRPARERGHVVETVNLAKLDLRHCTGCFGCNNADMICVVKDDLRALVETLARADGIAIAAPCFAVGAPSTLKTVMDRTAAAALEAIGARAPRKYGAAVLVGGAEDRWISMQRLLPAELMQLFNCVPVGMFTIGGVGLRGEILLSPSWLGRVRDLGERLVRSVEDAEPSLSPFTENERLLVCPTCRSDAFHVDRSNRKRCVVCGTEIRRFRPLRRLLADRSRYAAGSTFTPQRATEHTTYIGEKIAKGMGSAQELQARLAAYFETGSIADHDYEMTTQATHVSARVEWAPDGEAAFSGVVPRVLRGFVRNAVERKAQSRGISVITREVFLEIKKESGN